MNRELKFRAWIKKYKRMSEVTSLFPRRKSLQCTFDRYTFDEVELMEYTGLKDKNGVEIYEGDIVKVTCREEDIGQVIYEYNGFTVDVMNMNRPYGRVDLLNNFAVVIGNIYENSELLKESEE